MMLSQMPTRCLGQIWSPAALSVCSNMQALRLDPLNVHRAQLLKLPDIVRPFCNCGLGQGRPTSPGQRRS